jgi:hypothetical protein
MQQITDPGSSDIRCFAHYTISRNCGTLHISGHFVGARFRLAVVEDTADIRQSVAQEDLVQIHIFHWSLADKSEKNRPQSSLAIHQQQ